MQFDKIIKQYVDNYEFNKQGKITNLMNYV